MVHAFNFDLTILIARVFLKVISNVLINQILITYSVDPT